MENSLLNIGAMARACGLPVSALRFYDGAGVLVPAVVDPATGYRRYAAGQVVAGRIVAGLRRVGMPLAEITALLAALPDPEPARRLTDAHLRRLQDGLADARRELSRVRALLDPQEAPMTVITVPATGLAAAFGAVRFAVGRDPDLPALGGVLIEVLDRTVRLVATDRFRLAVADLPEATVTGPDVAVIVEPELLDAVAAGTGPVELTVTRERITAGAHTATPLPYDFPDYRRLLPDGAAHRVTVHAGLRDAIAAGTPLVREWEGRPFELVVLTAGADGEVRVGGDGPDAVAVNRDYLIEALDAAGPGPLTLDLDGPIRPLAIRLPADSGRFSLLMPTRL